MLFLVYAILSLVVGIAALAIGFLGFLLFYRFPGHYFDSNGVRIFYREEGSGVPVILVHGLGVNSDLNWRWPRVVERLRKHGYRVITMDARGHGKSDKPHDPEKYGVEMANDVLRLMDHLGIEKAHIAGYSMGGFITLRFITMHPERVLSAAICASGWSTLDEENLALMDDIVKHMEQKKLDPVVHWLDHTKKSPKALVFALNHISRLNNDFAAMANLFRNFPGLVVEEEALRNNKVPTITIVGDRDGIRVYSDKTAAVMGNHEIVYLPGGDHWNAPQLPGLYKNMRQHFDKYSPKAL